MVIKHGLRAAAVDFKREQQRLWFKYGGKDGDKMKVMASLEMMMKIKVVLCFYLSKSFLYFSLKPLDNMQNTLIF